MAKKRRRLNYGNVEVNNLSIQFGGLHAVDNFHMKIEKGELYGLIGPNWMERLFTSNIAIIKPPPFLCHDL